MFFVTVASVKTQSAPEEADRLRSLGYQVWRKNGRYYAKLSISTLGVVKTMWDEPFFNLPHGEDNRPELISVRFYGVTCSSIGGCLVGQVGKVIMTEPSNPVHSPVYSFALSVNMYEHEIEVGMGRASLQDAPELFVRVLKICAREFYREGGKGPFNGRKYLKRARRRYLLWLGRERMLSPEDEPDWEDLHAGMLARGEQIGKLEGAEKIWKRVVETERALQEGIE